jgi:putative oxidoreductase
MERLYSQYPGGVVGLALLLLRIVIGSWLTRDGVYRWIMRSPAGESTLQIVIGILLAPMAILIVFGLRTSFVMIAGAVLLLASELSSRVSDGRSGFCLLLQVCLCASVALLGPGGYSLDARLSGWKSIDISSRKKN